jgi:hypothetical protein
MLTLPSTTELESRLEEEAAKRGLPAPEYALRLIEALLKPEQAGDAAEKARLAAIDDLMGAAADSSFSSAELRRERNQERELEEARHLRRFGRERQD